MVEVKKHFKGKKILSYIFGGLSIFLLMYGLCLLIDFLFFKDYLAIPSFSFASIPISIGLALFAISLSIRSDIKMDINSNESFLRIVDDFEDKRIELFWLCSEGDYKTLTRDLWKFRRHTERAVRLYEMENILKDNFGILFNQVDKLLFWTGIPWTGVGAFRLRRKDVDNVLKVCELLKEFKLDGEQEAILEESIDYVGYLFSYCID